MIGTLNKQILISVPSKCGYRGLLNCFVNKLGMAEEVKPHHGWHPHGSYKRRVLLVRDPLERWVSLYWFVKNVNWKSNAWNKYRESFKSFTEFSELVANFQGRMLMLQPQDRYKDFNPHVTISQETISEDWNSAFNDRWFTAYASVSKHPTKGKTSVEDTIAAEGFHPDFKDLLKREYEFLGDIYANRFREVS